MFYVIQPWNQILKKQLLENQSAIPYMFIKLLRNGHPVAKE